jgi:protein tyrosine phosphatase (PTP) superfamily phosphohydrolase (DUF442 family)
MPSPKGRAPARIRTHGHTTEFDGSVSISPPLNAHEIAYLRKFAASGRATLINRQPDNPEDCHFRTRGLVRRVTRQRLNGN